MTSVESTPLLNGTGNGIAIKDDNAVRNTSPWKESSTSEKTSGKESSFKERSFIRSISVKFPGEVTPAVKELEASFSIRRLSHRKLFIIITLAFVNFCANTCFSLLAPFFPAEAAKKGASDTVVGFIFGIFEFTIFISAPIFGHYITKIGCRFLFLSGAFVCGICAILFGVLNMAPDGIIFIVMCFLSRTIEALGASAFITASFAIVAHEFPKNVATVFGFLETFGGIGFMVGPLIGGALYEVGGFGLPFFVLGTMVVLCGCICYRIMPIIEDDASTMPRGAFTLLKSPLALIAGLNVVSGSYSLGLMDPTLSQHLEQFNLRPLFVGMVFLLAPGVYAFTAPIWGYMNDHTNWATMMLAGGSLLSGLVFFALGPAPFLPFLPTALWLIIVTLLLLGLTLGCSMISTFKNLIQASKDRGMEDNFATYGKISGMFNSCFSLGAFIGPTLGGVLQDKYGFGWATSSASFLYLFSGSLLVIYMIVRSKQEKARKIQEKTGNTESLTSV